MGYGILIYVVYAAVAVAMTALLARTLYRAGGVFLVDVFEGKPQLAAAVNRLLVVGFYMLNLGYGLFLLRAEPQPTAFDAVAYLVNRVAILLITLGVIHFVNVLVFWRIRHRAELRNAPPPVAPQIYRPRGAGERLSLMDQLTVYYDEACAVCRRARDWLLTQPTYVPVELIPAGSPAAIARLRGLPWLGRELVAADERGNLWVGPAAFLVALWATRRHRGWSLRMSGEHLAPLAESFFKMVSTRRHRWSRFLGDEEDECSWCQNQA